MGLNLDELPDKTYFTFSELTARWKIDTETILHYVLYYRILPAAVKLNYYSRKYSFEKCSPWEVDNILGARIGGPTPPADYEYIKRNPNENTTEEPKDHALHSLDIRPLYILNPDFLGEYTTKNGEEKIGTDLLIGEDTFKEIGDHGIEINYCRLVEFVDGAEYYKKIPLEEFSVIPIAAVESFEKEFNITSDTVSVVNQVSRKTQNKHIALIRALSEGHLDRRLSDKPHADAAEIDRILSRKNCELPCTLETLARYLKESQE